MLIKKKSLANSLRTHQMADEIAVNIRRET